MDSWYRQTKGFIGTFLRRNLRYSRLFRDLRTAFSLHPQEQMLEDIMQYLASTSMEGDYLEFGVYEGWSLIAAYKFAELNGLDRMRFIAFDSFQGLPEPSGVDLTDYPQYQTGDYASDQKSFERNLRRHGVPFERVTIVPGWFEDTLNKDVKKQLELEKAAVAWIDCDLYMSTVSALDFLTDLVQPGTIVIFDDWMAFRGDAELGEQKAFREWLARNPHLEPVEFGKMGWHGMAFVLQTRQAGPK